MKQLLQSISTRERTMLAALIIVGLLIWASLLNTRWEASADTLKAASQDVKKQKVWIDSAPHFYAQLDQVLKKLDPAQMLDGTGLSSYIDSYAREHKLKHEMTTPVVKSGQLYERASMRVSLRNISFEELIKLQIELDTKRPYIAVEAIALVANRADPRLLNARLNLTAITILSDTKSGT